MIPALRAIAVAVLEAAVVLAAVTAVFWAAVGPQDLATMAWLAVMFVTVAGSGVALEWLGRRRRKEAGR